jgi:uncharacterized protein (DUF2235 family)
MKRLIICFDGTWNRGNSGTNIYHLSNLIAEGPVTQDGTTIEQLISYDAGVGTGVLDSITGGGFGVGLSTNVWEAYDWLVEKYDDGDELYVFGFSRGAFTARSLIGLIAKCGLLYRGAPLPTDEMWAAYQVLGRYGDPRTRTMPKANWWERLFGRQERPFRPIWQLKRADWDDDNQGMPVYPPANAAERLLVRWSRRVKVHCVGVFDTVGSIGLDALAIPGLRSRLAQFHDTHLCSLIVNGYQALAIDEHRANFSAILWRQRIDANLPVGRTKLGGEIEQCWFVGAHSNVGGGYPDDALAQYPLEWMMKKTAALGLVYKPITPGQPVCNPAIDLGTKPALRTEPKMGTDLHRGRPPLRDSYTEFGGGVWKHLIRSKRDYRRIAGPAERENGAVLAPVNETVHASAIAYYNATPGPAYYSPPNLYEYLHRERGEKIAPKHRWLDDGAALAWLAIWAAVIGIGGAFVGYLLGVSLLWTGVVVAAFALGVDWTESRLNFESALHPEGTERASDGGATTVAYFGGSFLDAALALCLTLRLTAVGLFGVGLYASVAWALRWIVNSHSSPESMWLLGISAALATVMLATRWCGYPMTEAGMGSIVRLQTKYTPQGVLKCLQSWSGGMKGSDACRFLQPVAESLYRDMIGYIPWYALVLFATTTLATGMYRSDAADISTRLMAWRTDPICWQLATVIMGIAVLADYVEDVLHLQYLKWYPSAPGRALVATAFSATLVKFGCLATAGVFTLAMLVALAGTELSLLYGGRSGFVGAAVVLSMVFFAGLVVLGTVGAWLRKRAASHGDNPPGAPGAAAPEPAEVVLPHSK